jgi:hypothetical protein
MTVHDRRAPLVVRPETWAGTDVFCIREMERIVFNGKFARRVIEENEFSNVEMKERGYIRELFGPKPVLDRLL